MIPTRRSLQNSASNAKASDYASEFRWKAELLRRNDDSFRDIDACSYCRPDDATPRTVDAAIKREESEPGR
jgi:hypothetical protein